MRNYDPNKLALIALEMASETKDGVLEFVSPYVTGKPGILLGTGELRKLFPGQKSGFDPCWTPDTGRHVINYMGVEFYEIFPIDNDPYEGDEVVSCDDYEVDSYEEDEGTI